MVGTLEFILGCVMFGAAGLAMYDVPWYRMVLIVLLVQGGAILVRGSGVI